MNYEIPSKYVGGLTGGYPSLADVPVQQPRFENIADRLANMPDGLAKAVHRIRQIADRYGGSTPEANSKDGATANPSNLVGRLEMATTNLDILIGNLHAQIDRLERF